MVQKIQMVFSLLALHVCCRRVRNMSYSRISNMHSLSRRTYTCVGIVPVAGDVVEELKGHKDSSASVLFVTIWELGEATGPLFLAPLSEIYGRFIVYNVANCLFIVGIVVSALSQNINLLIFSRFLTGCAVATNVLNPAIIADIFPSASRGAAMSAVMLAPLIGGALGYVIIIIVS